jgi:flagellar protein FliO/FliZ
MKFLAAGLLSLFATAPLHASEKAGERLVEPFAGGQVAEIVVGLFVVLFIIGVVAWLVRRVPGLSMSTDGRVRVVSGVSVGQRERILLVEVGEQQLLVGVAPGRVETLHILDEPLRPIENGGDSTFARSFHGFVERFRHQQESGGGRSS